MRTWCKASMVLAIMSMVLAIISVLNPFTFGQEERLSRPATTRAGDLLQAAQLRVLRAEVRSGPESASMAREQCTAQGFSPQEFSPAALRRAAIEHAANAVLHAPPTGRSMILAREQGQYGLSYEDILPSLPPKAINSSEMMRRYVGGSPDDRFKLLEELSQPILTTSQMEELLEAVEKGVEAGPAKNLLLLHVLRGDITDVGLRQIYKCVLETNDRYWRDRFLAALEGRCRIAPDLQQEVADKFTDPASLRRLFLASRVAWDLGQREAGEFLVRELASEKSERRSLAVEAITARRVGGDHSSWAQVRDVIFREPNSSTRARMVAALKDLAYSREVQDALIDIIEKDSASEVRLAALGAIPLIVGGDHPDQINEVEQLMSRIEKAVAVDPQAALTAALRQKSEDWRSNNAELRDARSSHRARLKNALATWPE